jgi:hypothetical protein
LVEEWIARENLERPDRAVGCDEGVKLDAGFATELNAQVRVDWFNATNEMGWIDVANVDAMRICCVNNLCAWRFIGNVLWWIDAVGDSVGNAGRTVTYSWSIDGIEIFLDATMRGNSSGSYGLSAEKTELRGTMITLNYTTIVGMARAQAVGRALNENFDGDAFAFA